MRAAFLILAAFLLASTFLQAQEKIEPLFASDSSQVKTENLVEQSAGDENSPLMDVIEPSEITNVQIRSRFTEQLQPSNGFTAKKYLGTRLKSYQRIKASHGKHLSAGLLVEKDAGEQNIDDFMAGYIRYTSLGPITSVIVGNYVIEAGQGLALWRGFDFQKGVDVILPVRREGRELVPYVSSDENNFFRGVAVSAFFSNISATVYYSKKSLSASVDASGEVTSFYTAGYFRTTSELNKLDALDERLLGGRLRYHLSNENIIGLTGYTTSFSRTLSLGGNQQFLGEHYGILSADYNFNVLNINLFGEWTKTSYNSFAGLSGIVISPAQSIDIISAYRNYQPDFFNLHANAFGERSGASNETGFYVGLRLRTIPGVLLTTYLDEFRTFEPTPTSVYPTSGNDFLIQSVFSPERKLHVTVRYHYKVSERQTTGFSASGFAVNTDEHVTKKSMRFNIDFRFSPRVNVRTRIEYVDLTTDISQKYETGVMMYDELSLRTTERLWLDFRVVFFGTKSFDTGIAEYESDLPGALTVPILYGHGVRWYAIARYEATDKIELSLKYSDTIRDDVKYVGSGLDELPTNHDNRFGMQVDFRF